MASPLAVHSEIAALAGLAGLPAVLLVLAIWPCFVAVREKSVLARLDSRQIQ